MSEEDINKAIKEAEMHAAEDKARKEEVEVKNKAESCVYQTEKTMKDLDDKMDPADKSSIQEPLDRLKKAIEENNTENMKAETDNVTNAFSKVAEKIYAQVQPEGGQPNPQDFTGFNGAAGAGPEAGAEGGEGFKSAGGDF